MTIVPMALPGDPAAKLDASRAHEILLSHGADVRRWPDGDRAAMDALIAAQPHLRSVQRETAALDALLDEWAGRDLGIGGAAATAAAARVMIAPPPRPWRRWATGGGIAAGVAALLIAGLPLTHREAAPVAPLTVAGATITDEAAFAMVFTPTPDEESVI